MSAETLPPPQPAVCLTRSYVSRGTKGGTVIAEEVVDLKVHREWLVEPDAYRQCVTPCRRCGAKTLHAHCFRDRHLRPGRRGDPVTTVSIRLYLCAARGCGAVFSVLPAFIARHLWRSWTAVEKGVTDGKAPRSTRRRWQARLSSSARGLLQLFLALAVTPVRDALAGSVDMTRHEFVGCLTPHQSVSPALAGVAAWIHRLEPGIRLM